MSSEDEPHDDTVSWGELLGEVRERLATAGVGDPDQEARWIVEDASGLSPAQMLTGGTTSVTVGAMKRVQSMLARRAQGEPLQYVLGHWSFRSLDLLVDQRVLIPRPETEQLVEVALTLVDQLGEQVAGDLVAVDLGTGSGAVALSLARERNHVQVWATDRSDAALEVAMANLAGVGPGATRVRLAQGSWFDALPAELAGQISLVVSNPPYVADGEPLPASVDDWEPADALRAGSDGLDDLRQIVAMAPRWLAPDGALVLECDPRQVSELCSLAESAGFAEVVIHHDLAGRPRIVVGRRQSRLAEASAPAV